MSVSLCSVNDMKSALRIPQAETSQDVVLGGFINNASARCQRVCDRIFTYATYTGDLYDGGGRTTISLRQWPVDSGATFTLQYMNAFTQIQQYDVSDYIVLWDRGIVELLSGLRFPKGPGSVISTFSAGYQPTGTGNDAQVGVPDDLSDQVKDYAVILYQAQQGVLLRKDAEAAKVDVEMLWRAYARLGW